MKNATNRWIILPPGQTQVMLRRLLFVALSAWAATASVLAWRNTSTTQLLLLDDAGLRPIEYGQFAEEQEQIALVKEFVSAAYTISSETADRNAKRVRFLVSDALLESRSSDLIDVFERAKREPLTQSPKLGDLRTLGDGKWQADLVLHIRRPGALEQSIQLRVDLALKPKTRTSSNWRAWQIGDFDEKRI